MPQTPYSLLERRLKIISLFTAILIAVVALMVIIGWITHFINIDLWDHKWSEVKINTGIGLLLAATALIILNYTKHTPLNEVRHWAADFLSIAVFTLGLLTFLEFLLQKNFGIDEFFIKDLYVKSEYPFPGRMSFFTSFNFIMTGISLLLLNKGNKAIVVSQIFTFIYGVIALVHLLGYIFEVQKFYTYNGYSPMGIYTTIGFVFLMIASFFSTPRIGIMKFITERTQAGRFFRILFPVTMLMVMLAAIISINIRHKRLEKEYFEHSVIYPALFIFFALILWFTAYLLARYEKRLKKMEADYAIIVENSFDAVFIITGFHYTFVNHAFTQFTGYSVDEVTNPVFNYLQLHPDKDKPLVQQYMEAAHSGEITERTFLAKILTKDLQTKLAEISCTIRKDENNQVQIFGIVHDITDKWQAHKREKKLLRFNQFIGKINEMIVRVTDEEALFKEVCAISVNVGQFKMCWIGKSDASNNQVIPVAWAGEEQNYLSVITAITMEDEPSGKGPVGVAFREGKYYYSNDIENDPVMLPWRMEALKRNYRSSISLPLKVNEKIAGALTLYADEVNYFNAEEIDLLVKVADNISIALQTFEAKKEKRVAEQQLEQSERRFRLLAENANDIVFRKVFTPEEKFEYISPSVETITGYTAEEFYKEATLSEKIIHPDDRWIIKRKIVEKTVPLNEMTLRFIKKDGSIIWIEEKVNYYFDEKGKVTIAEGIARDITERKTVEIQLKEALAEAERFRMALNMLPSYVYMKDTNSRYIYANDATLKLFGCTFEQLISTGDELYFPADVVKELHQIDQSVFLGNDSQNEIAILNKKGERRIYLNITTPVYTDLDKKEIAGLLGISTDITEKKQAEELMQIAFDRLQKIASRVPGMIFEFRLKPDGSFDFPYVSDAVKFIYQVEPAEVALSANKIFDAIHPDDYEKVVASTMQSAKSLTPWIEEFRLKLKDGTEKIILGNSMPQKMDDGSIIWYGFIQDITHHKKTELLLQETYDRLQNISSQLPGIIFQFTTRADGSSYYPYVSPSVKRILGLDPEALQMDASFFYNKMHPEDLVQVKQDLEESARLQRPLHKQYRIINNDGTLRWMVARLTPKVNADGYIEWYGYTADVTEQKKAEEKLIQLSMAVEQSPASIIITDTKGTIQYVNSKFTEVTGYSQEEVIGQNPRILKSGKTASRTYEKLWKTIAAGHEWRGEFENIKKNGEVFWELASISPITNDKGQIINYLAIKEDITERKQIEKKLQESEEKYRTIFNASPFPIWMKRIDDKKFIEVNEAAVLHYGYTRDEFLKMTTFDIRPASEYNAYKKASQKIVNGYQGIWKHQKKSGELIDVEVYIYKMLHKGEPCYVGIAVDITEKQKAQNELKNAYEEVRQLAAHLQDVREEERYTISREIHDELGQQLTALKMGISFTLSKTNENETAIQEDLEDLKSMVGMTINSVRRISNHLRPQVLDDLGLVDALIWQCQEFEKRTGCVILFNSNEASINLPADKRLALFRIFQESLTNIMRYAEASKVNVDLNKTTDGLQLTVRDNGKGFDTQIMGKTKTLGLLGMKERTLMLNGKINIDSIPGKGTTIKLTVPLD